MTIQNIIFSTSEKKEKYKYSIWNLQYSYLWWSFFHRLTKGTAVSPKDKESKKKTHSKVQHLMYPLYKDKPLLLTKSWSHFGNKVPSPLHPPHKTTQHNSIITFSWLLNYFHKPASNGTPLPGIHESPAKKSPTVNFTASVLEITWNPGHLTLPPVAAPAPVLAYSP